METRGRDHQEPRPPAIQPRVHAESSLHRLRLQRHQLGVGRHVHPRQPLLHQQCREADPVDLDIRQQAAVAVQRRIGRYQRQTAPGQMTSDAGGRLLRARASPFRRVHGRQPHPAPVGQAQGVAIQDLDRAQRGLNRSRARAQRVDQPPQREQQDDGREAQGASPRPQGASDQARTSATGESSRPKASDTPACVIAPFTTLAPSARHGSSASALRGPSRASVRA